MNTSASQLPGMSTEVSVPAANGRILHPDERFIWRFSPNQTVPELLEAIFVGREPLLQNVIEKIQDSATSGATHHVLLWGPPGIGKSHFLSLLFHRLKKDETLRDTVRLARLNEGETTTSMVQLLVRVYRCLGQAYPDEFSLAWLDDVLNQGPEEVADVLTRRLVARFEKRRLVIIVENLDLLFEGLGAEGQHHLRTLLQEHPFACLMASSQQLFKAVADRGEPFFGFFQPIAVRPLSLPDAQQLLIKVAAFQGQQDLVDFLHTAEGRGRVQAIYDLAGGNPRVYIVLSRFLTRGSLDQLSLPFQRMMDDLTPCYQGRVQVISPLQRQIVELLCNESGTLNPKEIARRLLLTEQSIGKQVRNLVELGYLTANRKGRETFYELSDPLMRLTSEVKEGGQLIMLIEFLRLWYHPEKTWEQLSASQRESIQPYLNAAQGRSKSITDSHQAPLHDDLELAETQVHSEGITRLRHGPRTSDSSMNHHVGPRDCFETIRANPQQALAHYSKALEKTPESIHARFSLGCSFFALHRWEDGFSTISEALICDRLDAKHHHDIAAMFGLIFLLSEDNDRLQLRLGTLFRIYEQALASRRSAKADVRSMVHHNVNDLVSHLSVGLVQSLRLIDPTRVTAIVLRSYTAAIEQESPKLRELDIARRLFRCGINYLITKNEADFVQLISPERNLLRQALGLVPGHN
jgi:DNA-binding transcriptional ArsR family regulator